MLYPFAPDCSGYQREIALYILHILTDGDWENDWLTHIPEGCQQVVYAIGMLLAIIGSF